MKKVLKGPTTFLYPLPALLIGTMADSKPNFMTAAWAGVVNSEPPMISISMRRQRHSYSGIMQNQTFSVNVPSADLVKEVDFCGSVSGAKINKQEVCRLDIFYGKSPNAPLVAKCPINMECSVEHILSLGSHVMIVGRIIETHVSEDCLTNNEPDVDKIKPFVYIGKPIDQYRALGAVIGKAFSIGQVLRK